MSTINLLENLISYCSEKNKVISKNLANMGTENYQREEIIFKDILSSQVNTSLKSTSSKHINLNQVSGSSKPDFEIRSDNSRDMLSGINNVDIEKEMADLAENTIQFKFAARKIGDYYKSLQKVIKGGAV